MAKDTKKTVSTLNKQARFVNFDESYLGDKEKGRYSSDFHTMDIRYGGQWGLLPRIGGTRDGKPINEWMHEQAYLKRDVVCKVLQIPKMFTLLPNSNAWIEAVIALFEVHAKTIEGLNASLTVESQEHPLGLSGATMKEPSKVNREATSITLGGITEKLGNPFEILLDVWIRYGFQDPDTGFPLITRIVEEAKLPSQWTPEWYTVSAIFIEPDPLYRRSVHAWLVSNMYPPANPDIIGKKDKTAGREMKEISLEMGGFALPPTNKHVKALANKILGELKLWESDPDNIAIPKDGIDANAKAGQTPVYFEGVKEGGAKK